MIDENKRFNIIFIILSVIVVLIIIYVLFYIKNLKSANDYFNINSIINYNWINNQESASLKLTNDSLTFKLHNDYIFDNVKYKLNTHTGEIVIDPNGDNIEGELYLRSVGDKNIVIWYKEAEYRLDKDVVID